MSENTQIIIGEGHVGMARIVWGRTEKQLTEMCRQCVVKLGIVSSSERHWHWHTLSGPHYMRVCKFTYQETQLFSELRRYKRASSWLLAVSYAGKCTLSNDALVWIRHQFSSIQWTDFFVLH